MISESKKCAALAVTEATRSWRPTTSFNLQLQMRALRTPISQRCSSGGGSAINSR